ncbi:hypothetical protein D3C86_1745180 [compost metagenome]
MVKPCSLANFSAPAPIIITCGDFNITVFAAVIGFLIVVTDATEPAIKFFPSIIDASISFLPSLVNTAPFPALNNGESSIIFTAASTASMLFPPFSKTA